MAHNSKSSCPFNLDGKASLWTRTSIARRFDVRAWCVCRIKNHGEIERIVVMCEVLDEGSEWREMHVNYSPDFIEQHDLTREESLMLHARAQILSELNHIFGARSRSCGEWVMEIWCR